MKFTTLTEWHVKKLKLQVMIVFGGVNWGFAIIRRKK